MCCTRLAENTGRKSRQNSPSAHHRTTFSGYVFAMKACMYRQLEKPVKQQYLLHMFHNMMNFGPLVSEISWRVWGTTANFNGFRVCTGFVTSPTSLNGGQPNCLAVSWPGTLYILFRDLLPRDGILPHAKFTLCPSMHHRTSFSGYIFATKASIDNRKKTC